MKYWMIGLFCLATTGCASVGLSTRVDELEMRVNVLREDFHNNALKDAREIGRLQSEVRSQRLKDIDLGIRISRLETYNVEHDKRFDIRQGWVTETGRKK